MKKILKVTSVMGIATFVRIFSGLARAKFLAWQLGPVGIGLVGQATMYSTFAIQLCSLNIGIGITKEIAESLSQKKEENIPLITNTAITLQFIASCLLIISVLPFSKAFAKFVFSDSRYWIYFIMITLATPMAVALNGMADPIFYGFKKIADFMKLTILYTLIGLGLLFALVYFYKIEGMFVQIFAVSIAGFSLSYYFIRKKISIAPRLDFGFFKYEKFRAIVSNLFKYGLISFIPTNVNMLILLYVRGCFMKQYGVEANGYFQVAYAISAYYLPFVTNGLWGHFYPEMCSLKEKSDINRELNQFIRFTLFASAAIAAGAIIFRKYLILILFSSKFMSSYDLLAIQAIGDIFFILFCMFSTSLMARRKFKGVVLISTIGYNAALLSTYYIISYFSGADYRSLNIAIAFTNILLVAAHMIYARLETGFVPSSGNRVLFIKSMLFLAVLFVLPDGNPVYLALKLLLAVIWLLLSVSRDEFIKFMEMVSAYIKKRRPNA